MDLRAIGIGGPTLGHDNLVPIVQANLPNDRGLAGPSAAGFRDGPTLPAAPTCDEWRGSAAVRVTNARPQSNSLFEDVAR